MFTDPVNELFVLVTLTPQGVAIPGLIDKDNAPNDSSDISPERARILFKVKVLAEVELL
jgi:hypothetical protein